MKIFVDENIPLATVKELVLQGHDVVDIRGTDDQGITDEKLWQKTQELRCLLITTDKGFAAHREDPHHGILIIRLKQPSRQKIHQRVFQALKRHTPEQWPGLMVVMRDAVQSSWKAHYKK
ncbi:MAG: DUF5615 family PIN-like protein [Proteobacteria bacterium]|nr:DUF5615 family PIN-like protein [Pseudomonadota bacterium]MBU1389753.1 DUF5615 family PIN-like protein [Pseudomonadota bacterium]MBU1543762.1 DUF5615 family PIN-like protein [Pseudomonadota bacterium]MBU2429784.1 DUF5615 family PIN-like protein [Pseudomonadota bacterium]MBU2480117.1 DUF5615 family PIN-like protein [Pseudomonadota bacterium]